MQILKCSNALIAKKKNVNKMILCLKGCGYAPNHVLLYLYTMKFVYLCELKFRKLHKKIFLYSRQKNSTYNVRIHYCKRLLGKRNVDDTIF